MKKQLIALIILIGLCINSYAVLHTVTYRESNETWISGGVQATISYIYELIDPNCNYTARLTLEMNGTEVNSTIYYLNMTYWDYHDLNFDFNASCPETFSTNFSSYYSFNSTDCNESFHYYNSYATLGDCPTTTTTSSTSSTVTSSTVITTSTVVTSTTAPSSPGSLPNSYGTNPTYPGVGHGTLPGLTGGTIPSSGIGLANTTGLGTDILGVQTSDFLCWIAAGLVLSCLMFSGINLPLGTVLAAICLDFFVFVLPWITNTTPSLMLFFNFLGVIGFFIGGRKG